MQLKAINVPKCPFCHSSVADEAGSLVVCSCAAIYHNECAVSLGSCASCSSRLKNVEASTEKPQNIKTEQYASRLLDKPAELNALIGKKLWQDPKFEDAYKLAKANSKGKLWLIGGKVYRTIVGLLCEKTTKELETLYGDALDFGSTKCDFDFLTEKLTWFRHIPKELYKEITVRYAYSTETIVSNPFTKETNSKNPRFISSDMSVDVVSLRKAQGLIDNKLPKTLEGYLQATPMNIQSCAYDLEEEKLHITPEFRKALITRVVAPNHEKQLRGVAKRKGVAPGELLRRKAESLVVFSASMEIPEDKK